jgi:hypothetical protein
MFPGQSHFGGVYPIVTHQGGVELALQQQQQQLESLISIDPPCYVRLTFRRAAQVSPASSGNLRPRQVGESGSGATIDTVPSKDRATLTIETRTGLYSLGGITSFFFPALNFLAVASHPLLLLS